MKNKINSNSAIFIHPQKSILINFQTNSHNIKNLQCIIKYTFYTVSNPYGHNTPSILHASLQIFFSALFSRFPSIKSKLYAYHTPYPPTPFFQHVSTSILHNITSVLLKISVNSVMEKFVTKRRKEREKVAILQLISTFFQ